MVLREWCYRRSVFSPQVFGYLRSAALGSAHVGPSPLKGTFRSSSGFGISFTDAGVAKVRERFAFLEPFLDEILSVRHGRILRPWWSIEQIPPSNAFYLNLLLIPPGAQVGRHVDATLSRPEAAETVCPTQVSVLYLQTPEGVGGTLRLWEGSRLVQAIEPRAGAMVVFRGDLAHAVDCVDAGADMLRASLVCEQYHLEGEAYRSLPAYQVTSGGFGALMEAMAQEAAV